MPTNYNWKKQNNNKTKHQRCGVRVFYKLVLGPYKSPISGLWKHLDRPFIGLSKVPINQKKQTKKNKQLIYEQFRPTPSFQSFNSTVISKTLLKWAFLWDRLIMMFKTFTLLLYPYACAPLGRWLHNEFPFRFKLKMRFHFIPRCMIFL